jgi:hypothetical protein
MGTVQQIEARGGLSGDDLRYVVEAARTALDQEFQRAERYDTKARGQMTLAGSWFAVVQAVAAVALRGNTPTGWIIAIASAAAIAGVALFAAMRTSAKVWSLRQQPAVNQATLEDMLVAAERDPQAFGRQLVQLYRHLLGHAQEVNERRADAVDAATSVWWWALGLTLVELAIALLSRVFGA